MITMHTHRNGFTIVELILTLTLVGVVGMMLAPYYQSGVTNSPVFVNRVKASAELQYTMENLIQWLNKRAKDNYAAAVLDADDTLDFAKAGATDLTALKQQIDTNLSAYTPSGYSVTVVANSLVNLYTYATPSLSSMYEQDVAGNQKQYLLVTLRGDNGGTITYIFAEGYNYPLFASS